MPTTWHAFHQSGANELPDSVRAHHTGPRRARSHAIISRSLSCRKGDRSQDTKPEVVLRSDLHRRGLRFRKNRPVHADGARARVDVCFTRARVAVSVDGRFWHACPDHGTIPKWNRDYWAPEL